MHRSPPDIPSERRLDADPSPSTATSRDDTAEASRSLTAPSVVLIASIGLFGLLTHDVIAHGRFSQVDSLVATSVHAHRSGALTAFMSAVTHLHDSAVIAIVSVSVAAGLWWRRQQRWAGAFVAVVGGGTALNAIVKHLVERARPPAELAAVHAGGYSFPSGHTAAACMLYGFAALYAIHRSRGTRTSGLAVVAAVFMVCLVGSSRVVLGVHYLSDVIGSALEGLAWILACHLAGRMLAGRVGGDKSRISRACESARHQDSEHFMNRAQASSVGHVGGAATSILNKVPEVTLAFWVVKILSTTVGETLADYLAVQLGLGTGLTGLVVGVALVAMLVGQLRSTRYVPWLYWATVVLVSIAGTLITDALTDGLGVSLYLSTFAFAPALGIVFLVWHRVERTLSIRAIDTRRRELFYWSAILLTFAFGTAGGDLATEALGLGFQVGVAVFALAIVGVALAREFGAGAVSTFWIAYILTRPLGASLGDYLSQSTTYGGLGLGAIATSAAFLAVITAIVVYLTLRERHAVGALASRQPS